MAKHVSRKMEKRGAPAPQSASVDTLIRASRGLALGGLAALLVATPLIPSEGTADLGTGVMLLMLWLVLLAGWLAVTVLQNPPVFRFDWPDAAVAAFFVLASFSALVAVPDGYGRATINMAWQWLSFGVCYFLTRQLLRSRSEVRTICIVMIGLAVSLSALSLHQVLYSLPETRAAYEQNPEAMLRAAGIDATEGSPERRLFEDRLRSTEPSATFALANSLAGLVAPWLILCLGIGLTIRRWQRPDVVTLSSAVLVSLCLAFCLMLTKSRTAVLAVVVGAALLALWRWRRGRGLDWRVLAAGGTAAVVLATGILVAALFDRLVLTETLKSAGYRFQYWQSTASLIADHPWFGCGPGNFQQAYTRYKLPEASEAISDPHNLLFEVWSTLGTFAMLALLTVLVLLAYRVLRTPASPDGSESQDESQTHDQQHGQRAILVGACAGFLLGYVAAAAAGFAPDPALLWLGGPAASLTVLGLRRWALDGVLPTSLVAIAWLVLTINLLAAGGISFAGVALTWWLFVAIIVSQTEIRSGFRAVSQPAGVAALLVSLILAAGCYWTMYRPVLGCQAALHEGLAAQGDGQIKEAEAAYLRAARSDPYSVEPWLHLAALYANMIKRTGSTDRLEDFDNAAQEAIRRRGSSHTTFRQLGEWRMDLYACLSDPAQLQEAQAAYQRWVNLYPNNSMAHAQLAWAQYLSGNALVASKTAEFALALDQKMPHRERKLSEQRIHDPTGQLGDLQNAEQLMHRLRR